MIHQVITWYFFIMAVISLFCLGWRNITNAGKIFYPLRRLFEPKPVDKEILDYEAWNKKPQHEKAWYQQTVVTEEGNKRIQKFERTIYSEVPFWSIPFIMCVECMPSFWGTIIYWLLCCLSGLPPILLLICYPLTVISCSFVTGFLWKKYSNGVT